MIVVLHKIRVVVVRVIVYQNTQNSIKVQWLVDGIGVTEGSIRAPPLASLLHPKLKISLPHTEHWTPRNMDYPTWNIACQHESFVDIKHWMDPKLKRTLNPAEYGLSNMACWHYWFMNRNQICQTYSTARMICIFSKLNNFFLRISFI